MVTGYVSQSATTSALLTQIGADSMTVTLQGVAITLGIAVFLTGVGFAWRKITQKATGKKF